MPNRPRFIVDQNVGKLTRYLRMMGYDAVFFDGEHDGQMVATARREKRIILTKDSGVMQRRVITKGPVEAVFIEGDQPPVQIRQVVTTLGLDPHLNPFSICLECNQPLEPRTREEVADQVPAYVFRTQTQYRACPACGRVYWQGTHWQAMTDFINDSLFVNDSEPVSSDDSVNDSESDSINDGMNDA